ncbi:CHAD domain-containing protein [Aquabacter cavernae]|uniref:CHAD domain-containing protein n=1 Tax=Aquabacter cavernae TaxID=2496029 RepID=UPI0013DFB0FB|nr:CHAD domain-containing protein [Aquabacter cavernae]
MPSSPEDTASEAPAPPPAEISEGLGLPLAARLESALDKVQRALAAGDPVVMVHDARKALKEYRALLRLIPGSDAQAARRSAAAAARELSGARDNQASRDALADLVAAGLAHEDSARAIDALSTSADAASDAAPHERVLQRWLSDTRRRHARTLDAQAARADVVAGLRKAYAKARDALDVSDPEALHDLRKRVVTHRYQMSFLADVAAGRGAERATRAQKLRDLLGRYQDIETLRHRLDATRGNLPDDLIERIDGIAETHQDSLTRKARRLHAELFRVKPRAFGRKTARRVRRARSKQEAAAQA